MDRPRRGGAALIPPVCHSKPGAKPGEEPAFLQCASASLRDDALEPTQELELGSYTCEVSTSTNPLAQPCPWRWARLHHNGVYWCYYGAREKIPRTINST